MTLPDFLVIGAAKSGTVSLYHYLGQHPQIYMSPINETNFFALDGYDLEAHFRGPGDRATVEQHCVQTLEAYQALFAGARPEQQVGESSPLYLYSDHAPRRIRHYLPDVKLIAILRQPSERAYSNYRHYRQAGIEPLVRFEQALAAEAERRDLGWGPWPFWLYRDVGTYARQLERYYTLFDEAQILVCLYEELQADPVALVQKLYAFIGVDQHFVPDTSIRHNVSNRPRLQMLHRLMTQSNHLKRALKIALPDGLRVRLRDALHGWNQVGQTLEPTLRRQLDQAYAPDIRRLEGLTGRDLSHWLDIS